MNGNSLGVVLSPGASAGAERSGGERSEPQRSAAPAKGGRLRSVAPLDSEVVADLSAVRSLRSTNNASCKKPKRLRPREVLLARCCAAKGCTRRCWLIGGMTGNGTREALTPRKRGPKSKYDPLKEENLKLQRQNARLTEDLRKAHIIIDVQKKVAALLGRPLPDLDPEENS